MRARQNSNLMLLMGATGFELTNAVAPSKALLVKYTNTAENEAPRYISLSAADYTILVGGCGLKYDQPSEVMAPI